MATYEYRRDLKREDWMRVAGIAAAAGIGVGVATAYFARILIQRTPLSEQRMDPPVVHEPRRPELPRARALP